MKSSAVFLREEPFPKWIGATMASVTCVSCQHKRGCLVANALVLSLSLDRLPFLTHPRRHDKPPLSEHCGGLSLEQHRSKDLGTLRGFREIRSRPVAPKTPTQPSPGMSLVPTSTPAFAPDGRQLSPGEVWEEEAPVVKKEQEWREDLNVLLICPDCREVPPNLVENFSRGDTVCGDCGRVLSEKNLDFRSEWRTFSNDDQGNDDPSRIGEAANPLLHGSQLHTEIAFGDASNRHRELSRAQNKSNADKTNKSLSAAYASISTLCEQNSMNKTIAESAKLMYKMTDDEKLFKGKSQDAVIAGCIFIACRQHGYGRSFREIYKLTRISKKEIGRTFKILDAFIGKKKKEQAGAKAAGNGAVINANNFNLTKATTASELIGRACSRLHIGKLEMIAKECASKVNQLGVAAGRSPLSITGAVLYLVSHLMGTPKTPKEIGAVVDVSDGTIRTAYKLMYARLDDIVETAWIEKGGDKSRVPVA